MMSEADSGSTDQLAELATAKPATTSATSSETETPSSLPLPSDQSSSSHPAPASSEEDGDASLNISKKVSSFNDYYYKTVDNFMSRLGASPIATAPVPADVSLAVEDILSKGLEGGGARIRLFLSFFYEDINCTFLSGPPNDNRVSDIVWGWSTDGR